MDVLAAVLLVSSIFQNRTRKAHSAMMSRTILDVLTTPRDEPDSSKVKKSPRSTENKNYLHTDEIQDWAEFTFENVHLAFKEFLDQPVPDSFKASSLPKDIRQPRNETALRDMFKQSTAKTVNAAAEIVMKRFPGLFPPGRVEMHPESYVYKSDDIQLPDMASKPPRVRPHIIPDFVQIYLPDEQQSLPENDEGGNIPQSTVFQDETVLLMGEGKISTGWSFDRLTKLLEAPHSIECSAHSRKLTKRAGSFRVSKPTQTTVQGTRATTTRKLIQRPTDQLGTYCVWGKVPFGFLQTEREFFLCNTIRIWDPETKTTKAGMKAARISWDAQYRPNTITPELALFCVTLAALYTHNNLPLTAYSHEDIITWHRVAGQHGARKDVRYRNKFSGLMHPYSELRKHKHLILLEAEDE